MRKEALGVLSAYCVAVIWLSGVTPRSGAA